MGKTHDDEVYEDGVSEGQRGGFLDDFVEGNITHTSKDAKIHHEGYVYGAQHRYGKNGRYHSYDGSGSNDPKSSGNKSKSSKGSKRTSRSSEGGFRESDRHYHGWDSDYESTWDDMGVGEKVIAATATAIFWGLAAVFYSILALPLIFIGKTIYNDYKSSKQPISINRTYNKGGKINNLEGIVVENSEKMLGLDDYAVCPEDLKIIFSKQTSARYWIGLGQSSGIRYRLFYCDMDGSNKEILDFSKLDRGINYRISSQDFVAPIVSENDKRMVFAVTRGDSPSFLYTIESLGAGRVSMKRLSPCYSSIAFGWVSNDSLFFWGSPYAKSTFSGNLELFKGERFLIDMHSGKLEKTENSLSKIISLSGSEKMNIKFVSYLDVGSYVIRKLE